ncbi:methyltransferase domain-containing protein [Desulfovibrio sp. JC022]|uniref:methyltransferase domain-containing protein n=1 Tax=Desulfovibrio sp. JC022 TaxID=2593642 RepID=UPI0013D4E86A|nr:methyltransferase domain-containing protein [Desulfovibrio sp. JC022]NDV22991.1 methyltransferase domain-containing protein [Desulfovibrio sp. JC022]
MSRNAELKKIVAEVGEDLIWRPLYDFENKPLADGVGYEIDGIDPEFKELDFTGKSVCDLGCNLGHFSFYARKRGAKEVVGYDLEPKVIAGAKKLAELYSVENVDFCVCNFAQSEPDRTFDMGMLIDIIGKVGIRKGYLDGMLQGLERRSESEMLLTFRPVYLVVKHLSLSLEDFMEIYPKAKIEDGVFDLLSYVTEFYSENWEMSYLSKDHPEKEKYKNTVYFQRK